MKICLLLIALVWFSSLALAQSPILIDPLTGQYLGSANANPLDLNSTANPMGPYGNPRMLNSPNNPLGPYGNPRLQDSLTNPYTLTPSLQPPPPRSYELPPTSQGHYDAWGFMVD